jgi:hypothetical protein
MNKDVSNIISASKGRGPMSKTVFSKRMSYMLRHKPPPGAALPTRQGGCCSGLHVRVGQHNGKVHHAHLVAEMGAGGFVPLSVILRELGPGASEALVRQIVATDTKVQQGLARGPAVDCLPPCFAATTGPAKNQASELTLVCVWGTGNARGAWTCGGAPLANTHTLLAALGFNAAGPV